jgi:hypothetical protein
MMEQRQVAGVRYQKPHARKLICRMFSISSCVREKVSEYPQVIRVDRLEDFGHCCIVGMPRSGLVLLKGFDKVILALICEPRHVSLSGKVGSMTDIAVVLLGERAAACQALPFNLIDNAMLQQRRIKFYC